MHLRYKETIYPLLYFLFATQLSNSDSEFNSEGILVYIESILEQYNADQCYFQLNITLLTGQKI